MAESTTITVRLPRDVEEKLGRLAACTQRSKSFLASEAIAAYVRRELEIVEGIMRGLDDLAAGRLVPHEQAMAELDAAIAAPPARKTARRR